MNRRGCNRKKGKAGIQPLPFLFFEPAMPTPTRVRADYLLFLKPA